MKSKNILAGILCLTLIAYAYKILDATASSTKVKTYNQIELSSTKPVSTQERDANNLIKLADLKPDRGFAINGVEETRVNLFGSVSDAGDINGDGFDDILLSTPDTYVEGKKYVGQAYVIFGSNNLGQSGNFDLKELNGTNGFIITGDGDDEALRFASNAGDVNDDGIDDIILGATQAGEDTAEYGIDSVVSGDPPPGRGYVIFGSQKNPPEIKLSDLDGSNGFLMEIDSPNSHLGRSVSGAGDINTDGIDDIIIGSSFAGSYVVFGDHNIGSEGTIDLSSLDGTQGFALLPYKSFWGHSVSSAGDVNADGIADLAIVAAEPETRISKNNTNSSANANDSRTVVEGGIAYVIYGNANIEHLQGQDLYLMDSQQGLILQDYGSHLDFTKSTLSDDSSINKSISHLGDVNGDGIDDLIVGIPGASNRADSYVIFGNRQ